MRIEVLIDLLRVLAWPAVVLVTIFLLRHEISLMFGRVREIEGPGDVKVTLDPAKVEEIIEEGRKGNVPASSVAQRIVKSATITDTRQARILRALLDDDGAQSTRIKSLTTGLLSKA